MKLREIPPVGKRRTHAFVDRSDGTGSFEEVDLPVYPPHPWGEALAARRKANGLNLREAARRLGIRASELSGLEHGSLAPERYEDWQAMMEVLGT